MASKDATPSPNSRIPERLYFRIGDVADLVGVKPYVLRYWETEFSVISPQKSNTGQRVYRRTDVENLLLIKHLLYRERYSIEGARKRISELRKDGELKSFKAEVVESKPSVEELKSKAERLKELRASMRELKRLLSESVDGLFRY